MDSWYQTVYKLIDHSEKRKDFSITFSNTSANQETLIKKGKSRKIWKKTLSPTPCPRHLEQKGQTYFHWLSDFKLPRMPRQPISHNIFIHPNMTISHHCSCKNLSPMQSFYQVQPSKSSASTSTNQETVPKAIIYTP